MERDGRAAAPSLRLLFRRPANVLLRVAAAPLHLWQDPATGTDRRLSDGRKAQRPQAAGTAIDLSREMSNALGIFDKFNLVTVPQPRWGFCLLEACLFFL